MSNRDTEEQKNHLYYHIINQHTYIDDMLLFKIQPYVQKLRVIYIVKQIYAR